VHPTVYVASVGADIDLQVVELVDLFNRIGARTTSSCQGEPGAIGGDIPPELQGRYGNVVFDMPQWRDLAEFLFFRLRVLFAGMDDDVTIEMTCWKQNVFLGWVYFRNEAIPEVTRRMRTFVRAYNK
jgi:hypothetical protein